MKKRKRRRRESDLAAEGSYICEACGETIVIPLDPSAGASQEYVEDCPVCCRPNVVQIHFDDGEASVSARGE